MVRPSPADCSLNPPNFTAPPLVSLELVCAVALAPTPARNATPISATTVRLRRRTGHLPRARRRHRRLAGRAPPAADGLVEHSGDPVGLLAEGHDGNGHRGEHETGLIWILALDEWQQREQAAA